MYNSFLDENPLVTGLNVVEDSHVEKSVKKRQKLNRQIDSVTTEL